MTGDTGTNADKNDTDIGTEQGRHWHWYMFSKTAKGGEQQYSPSSAHSSKACRGLLITTSRGLLGQEGEIATLRDAGESKGLYTNSITDIPIYK